MNHLFNNELQHKYKNSHLKLKPVTFKMTLMTLTAVTEIKHYFKDYRVKYTIINKVLIK